MTDISKITLYSGGHKGAEAEFGKLAEAWHMQEVNISFEGHTAERTRGVRVLSREELQKGDVSMEIVSLRMKRTYSRTDKIRKVIQSIFHMVIAATMSLRSAGYRRTTPSREEPAGGSSWQNYLTGR